MVPSFHQVCFLTLLTPAWFFSVTVPFTVPFIVLRSARRNLLPTSRLRNVWDVKHKINWPPLQQESLVDVFSDQYVLRSSSKNKYPIQTQSFNTTILRPIEAMSKVAEIKVFWTEQRITLNNTDIANLRLFPWLSSTR
jgi:hypothetical protein